MSEKIKASLANKTVIGALAAAVICLITRWLPWFTYGGESLTLVESINAFGCIMHLVGIIWFAVFMLLGRPKLSLVGVVLLLVLLLLALAVKSSLGLGFGLGAYLYILTVVVCAVTAFAAKKAK